MLGDHWEGLLGEGIHAPEMLNTPTDVTAAFQLGEIHEVRPVERMNRPSLSGINPGFNQPDALAPKPNGTLVIGFDNDCQRIEGRPDNILKALQL